MSGKFIKIAFYSFVIITFNNFLYASDSKNSILNIELVGTITGKHVLAIIRLKNHSEGIYQLNQKISGYSIKSITRNSVVLTKNNKLTTLNLIAIKKRKFYGSNLDSNKKPALVTYEYRINRKTFNSLANDTQSWLNNIGMVMHLENGYFTGYKINFIKKNSPAELLGLAEGDIIKGIDNTLIKKKPETFIKKFSRMSSVNQFILNMSHENIDFNLKFLIEDN